MNEISKVMAVVIILLTAHCSNSASSADDSTKSACGMLGDTCVCCTGKECAEVPMLTDKCNGGSTTPDTLCGDYPIDSSGNYSSDGSTTVHVCCQYSDNSCDYK